MYIWVTYLILFAYRGLLYGKKIFNNLLKVHKQTVDDVMVPRGEIIYIDQKIDKENQTNNIESLITEKNNDTEKLENVESDKDFEQLILDKIKNN